MKPRRRLDYYDDNEEEDDELSQWASIFITRDVVVSFAAIIRVVLVILRCFSLEVRVSLTFSAGGNCFLQAVKAIWTELGAQNHPHSQAICLVRNPYYYMASSVSGPDEPNRAL